MRALVEDCAPHDEGTLRWTEDEGYQFRVPQANAPIPIPLYVLGLCFVRLTTDPNFGQTMIDWANRNQN
jgi:hypothetical protein